MSVHLALLMNVVVKQLLSAVSWDNLSVRETVLVKTKLDGYSLINSGEF